MLLFTNWVDLDHYEVVLKTREAADIGVAPDERPGWALVAVVPLAGTAGNAQVCIYALPHLAKPLRDAGLRALQWATHHVEELERDLRGPLQAAEAGSVSSAKHIRHLVEGLLGRLRGSEACAMLENL
jgi:hypothetical protein